MGWWVGCFVLLGIEKMSLNCFGKNLFDDGELSLMCVDVAAFIPPPWVCYFVCNTLTFIYGLGVDGSLP